ncbi:DUF4384 domain-containing protein [Deinococcus peraridilitoris]|uniref:DUF4384 domain-containing protein n=1 Tax=Deinococcus peraridilitoris (strain DSM 19664 / LMG 22246 / CIP 109416 / KR-200) TaxID=937777 RepID=L0A3P7_DEIPD|nr:DUF4384 domain-containing protein [Deinococcus peraridilitoris]AFZ68523.1 hypothetical protein Deipe_3074 [Deinococcus peraridilitoris DSM 19664]
MNKALLLTALSLGLSACTVSVRPGVTVVSAAQANLIQNFQPSRGEGSSYFVGESVSFRFSSRTAGYLTLVSLDPNGRGNVLQQNIYVPAGTTVLPRPSDRVTFDLTPPRGLQRVRAIFTTVRPTTQIVFSGQYDRGGWNTYTDSYVQGYGPEQRDVYETFFYIR